MKSFLKKLFGSADASDTARHPASDRADVTELESPDALLINAYCTRSDVSTPTFPHQLLNQRDLGDPEMAPHLSGFVGYVLSRGDGQMTRTRYHLMRHIQRVQQQWSLLVDPAHMSAYGEWAVRANAISFWPDGSLLDAQGRTLTTAAGEEPDPAADVPYPDEAWARKARTDAALAAQGLNVSPTLPPVIAEPELRLRPPHDIAARASALALVAHRAHAIAAEPSVQLSQWDAPPAVVRALSPAEQAFIADAAPDAQQIANFGWRVEALAVLLWALGLRDELPFPSTIADVPALNRAVRAATDENGLLRPGQPRTPSDILDALDQTFRLHWLLRQANLDGGAPPAGVDRSVVAERHHALNWMVSFEDRHWDDVDTPT